MKVLLLNTYPQGGGAAIAAGRMLQGLIDAGVDARMLVAATITDARPELMSVHGVHQSMAFLGERIQVFFANGFDRAHLFKFSSATYGVDISHHPWVEWADIIHIHWVQQGFLSLKGLERVFALPGKRIFWSLHDLWPITGGCHIPFVLKDGQTQFCYRFRNGCKRCPILNSNRDNDLASRVYVAKQSWPYEKIQFLGVSRAVTRELKTYLERFPRALPPHTISNIIDSNHFYVEPRHHGTGKLKLLFVAARADESVKGLDLLIEVLQKATAISSDFRNRAELHIIGSLKKSVDEIPITVVCQEKVGEDELRAEYNSADVTLSTSRYETFGQTLLESITCGTPAMAFDVGGTSDIIQHQKNGLLINPYDIDSYAVQLLKLCQDAGRMDCTRITTSIEHFTAPKVIHRLHHLYDTSLIKC